MGTKSVRGGYRAFASCIIVQEDVEETFKVIGVTVGAAVGLCVGADLPSVCVFLTTRVQI